MDKFLDCPEDFDESETPQEESHLDESHEISVAKNTPNANNGTCISCKIRNCDIIFTPCFHIVVCSTCWEEKKQKHIRECEIIHKRNKRRMEVEKKKFHVHVVEILWTNRMSFIWPQYVEDKYLLTKFF